MKKYTRVCARIDLDAIEYNMEMMKNNLKEGTRIISVLKTDGYGHGAVQIARLLQEKDYIWGYATATLDEAVILRKKGIEKPILVLGTVFPDQRAAMIEHEVRMTLYTEEMAAEVSDLAARMGKDVHIHIKLDTGMSRLGFPICEESADAIERISKMPHLQMEGMFTHFAKADEEDKSFTEKQLNAYLWMKQRLEEKGVQFSYYHCSNSAGIIRMPEANLNIVRAGITIYGIYPSSEVERDIVKLEPVMELKSHVTYVKDVPAGAAISYGGTYVADRKLRVATVPVGYADGYSRQLSNKGWVLIHGQKAPILGRVCMDQFMVDVTEIGDVKKGDEVTLIGRDGDEFIGIEEIGDLCGRFSYEFACDISPRVPRVYIKNGKEI